MLNIFRWSNMNEVLDRIVKILSEGHDRNEVYKDIYTKCSMSIKTKNHKQQLADLIAQIDSRSVFAVGEISGDL